MQRFSPSFGFVIACLELLLLLPKARAAPLEVVITPNGFLSTACNIDAQTSTSPGNQSCGANQECVSTTNGGVCFEKTVSRILDKDGSPPTSLRGKMANCQTIYANDCDTCCMANVVYNPQWHTGGYVETDNYKNFFHTNCICFVKTATSERQDT